MSLAKADQLRNQIIDALKDKYAVLVLFENGSYSMQLSKFD